MKKQKVPIQEMIAEGRELFAQDERYASEKANLIRARRAALKNWLADLDFQVESFYGTAETKVVVWRCNLFCEFDISWSGDDFTVESSANVYELDWFDRGERFKLINRLPIEQAFAMLFDGDKG